MSIVGLPDLEVRESRERVRAALQNCGFDFPVRRISDLFRTILFINSWRSSEPFGCGRSRSAPNINDKPAVTNVSSYRGDPRDSTLIRKRLLLGSGPL
jgi:hypothetical protein